MFNILVALVILIGGLASSSGKTTKVNYIPPSPQIQAQVEGQEVIARRTKTTKTYQIGPNQYTLRASVGAQHYRIGPTDPWLDIDNNWYPAIAPWNWQMTQDSYTTKALSNLTAGQVIEYSSQGEYVRFQPMALQWTNNLSQIQQVSIPQNVAVTISNNRISWANGYGSGRSLAWINRPERLITLLTLNGIPPLPSQTIINGGNPVAELNFIFDPSSSLDIYVNGASWNKRDTVNSALAVEFRREGAILFAFAPPFAYDANGNEALVTSQLRRTGNNLYISVRVPYAWLQTAVYPVSIDPTFSIAASADDVYRYGATTFSTSNTLFRVGENAGVVYHSAARFILDIPSGSTINTCFLTLIANAARTGTGILTNLLFENAVGATQITSYGDFDGRSLGTPVPWDNIANWATGTSYNSPDLTAALQAVADLGTITAVNLFWKDDGSSTRLRDGASWDDTTYAAPALTATWTEPSMAKHWGAIF